MSYVAASVAAVGVGTQVMGGIQGGRAASNAARAQQDAAAKYQKYVQGQQDTALGHVLTPSAMAAHDQALQGQEQNVRRQEALVQSLDPNIIEAGKQTAQLLQGKSAPVMQNLQNQRQLQRDQLVQQLKTQLGPGAETSTAGQQQLNNFDQQTANVMSGAQQEYLDKVSNMSMGGAATLGQTLSQVDSALSSINEQGPEQKAAQLIASFTNAGAGAAEAGINAAGGQFRGAQLQGQALQQIGGGLMTGAALMAGKNSVGPGGPGGGTGAGSGTGTGDAPVTGGAQNIDANVGMMGAGGGMGNQPGGPQTLGTAMGGGAGAGASGMMKAAAAAPGGGAPGADYSHLGMMQNYGGGGNDLHNMNPKTWSYPDLQSINDQHYENYGPSGPIKGPKGFLDASGGF